MGSKHDLIEFSFAKDVTRDFPQIKAEIEQLRNKLLKQTGYAAVAHTVQAMNESLEMIEMQLIYYSNVIKTKGR